MQIKLPVSIDVIVRLFFFSLKIHQTCGGVTAGNDLQHVFVGLLKGHMLPARPHTKSAAEQLNRVFCVLGLFFNNCEDCTVYVRYVIASLNT